MKFIRGLNRFVSCRPSLLRSMIGIGFAVFATWLMASSSGSSQPANTEAQWIKVDDFEGVTERDDWVRLDTQNDTSPRIESPQITEVRQQKNSENHYLLKKPAAEGVIGNRKALSFRKLPRVVKLGETYTFYTRVNVEYFPNNHIFGLSNLTPDGIAKYDYDALEPGLRITDKMESDGSKNDGTLMVNSGDGYKKIVNRADNRVARPLQTDTWYEIWFVVNNAMIAEGGQKYDVFVRGGDEFTTQQKVFAGADFRMRREQPLRYFLANCNTGPVEQPYGNGGVKYDDIYMREGMALTSPRE